MSTENFLDGLFFTAIIILFGWSGCVKGCMDTAAMERGYGEQYCKPNCPGEYRVNVKMVDGIAKWSCSCIVPPDTKVE